MKKFLLPFILIVMFIPIYVNAEIDNSKFIIRSFQNEYNDERLEGAIILDDGSFIVAGYYYAYDDGRTDLGIYDDYIGIVMRYDKEGKLLWEKVIDNSYTLLDIAEDTDGTILVVGDGTIVRLDKNGNIIKVKTDFEFFFKDVAVDEYGNIYVTSSHNLLKLSKDFNIIDVKDYSESMYLKDIMIFDNEIIVCYNTNNNSIVEKLDSNLETIWSTNFNTKEMESLSEIDNKIIVNTSISLALLDKDGQLIWNKEYTNGSYNYIRTAGPSKNNTILAFGEEEFSDNNTMQVFILEYSLNGDIIDKKEYLNVPLKIVKPNCTYSGNDCACGGIIASKKGFVLTGFTIKKDIDYDPYNDDNFKGQVYGYMIYNTHAKTYKIKTKTDGNGTIEVIDKATGGESIQFKVTAKKGLKLTSLTITTDSGEKVEFNEEDITTDDSGVLSVSTNKFKMPYENITIEARWRSSVNVLDTLINPNTGTGKHVVISIIALVFSSSIYLIMKKRKITL